MGQKAFQEKLKEIGMSGYDASLYQQFSSAVVKQVQSLRVILGTLQAKNKERHWTRHQTSGELDDVKLIDGNFSTFISFKVLSIIHTAEVLPDSSCVIKYAGNPGRI